MSPARRKRKRSVVKRRPAEATTAATGLALMIGWGLGLDSEVVGALGLVIAAVPSGVTWVVELWRRRP